MPDYKKMTKSGILGISNNADFEEKHRKLGILKISRIPLKN